MFRRRSPAPPVVAVAVPAVEPCIAQGCRRRDGIRCSYVDKRARPCPTAWCPDHLSDVAGIVFCRRHASTMTAIASAELIAGLPDLDNRAPSLAGWMSRDLDGPIRDLLAGVAPIPPAALVTEQVRLLITPGSSGRRWVKSWKLIDGNEVVSLVAVEVDEADDCQVAALVDNRLVGHGIPPWIEHRLEGRQVDVATADHQRRQFAAAMARSIELVVTGQEVPERR